MGSIPSIGIILDNDMWTAFNTVDEIQADVGSTLRARPFLLGVSWAIKN
jgi:hypothetical protein